MFLVPCILIYATFLTCDRCRACFEIDHALFDIRISPAYNCLNVSAEGEAAQSDAVPGRVLMALFICWYGAMMDFES